MIAVNSSCPVPLRTAQRKESSYDVISEIKKLNLMSLLKVTSNYRIIRVNPFLTGKPDRTQFYSL